MRLTSLAVAAALMASGHAARSQGVVAAPTPAPAASAVAGAAVAAPADAEAPAVVPAARPGASGALPITAPLAPSTTLEPWPRGEAARELPVFLRARRLGGQPGIEAHAEGDVELRRGALVIRADRLAYDAPADRVRARGDVQIEREGAVYRGTELELAVQRFEGWFLEPQFELPQRNAGGRAERIDFLGDQRSRALQASYTSCPRDGPEEPAWVLRADRVELDLERDEGLAEGAVLRFLGTPILVLPTMSFPLGDTRRSGWLPPSLNIDNRSGVELAVPYYWNIAPNRDATITPRLMTRRGLGADLELRYLEPAYSGQFRLDALPDDRVARRARGALQWNHEGRLPWGLRAQADVLRVSDDDWWSDFPNRVHSLVPRLLGTHAGFERPLGAAAADGAGLVDGGEGYQGLAYLRTTRWQVLQSVDAPIVAPYERSAQFGLRVGGQASVLRWSAESEYNRFVLPSNDVASPARGDGDRVHLLASASLPWRAPGMWLTPRVSLNSAAYRWTDGATLARRHAARTIPSFSVDAGLEFERQTEGFGRRLRQTLEPRVMYVSTPYRAQSDLPDFDAAGKDFNLTSIYSDNAFSGVDRVSDAHQITAGLTTRVVDVASGAEALRLGIAQRYLLRAQRVTAEADGTVDGPALTQRFSDLLLFGSTSLVRAWSVDASLQYNADIARPVRSIIGVRYAPGPFRTLSANYRFARGLIEQLDVGWQWPLLARALAARGAGGSCSGNWYAVGRANYSLKDRRLTDALLGFEYDAGCWIGRVVAERLSTGSQQATTRLMFQLELVGLSRLGSNPLQVLKDNIPGYQMLRGEGVSASEPTQP